MAVKTDFQLLPKEFDEKVVKLHFPVLGAELTVLTHIKPQVDRFVFPDVHRTVLARTRRLFLSRLKAPSRLDTTVIERQSSAKDVVAGSVFGAIRDLDELFPNRARAGCASHVGKVPHQRQLMD